MFKVGQKVVCTCDSWSTLKKIWFFTITIKTNYKKPKKDKIYTIEDFGLNEKHNRYYVELKEFPGNIYESSEFRPIDELFAEGILENINEQIKEDYLAKT